jgi:hypothetical protein
LTREGFRNIFILGYSLGACMAAHWADPTIPRKSNLRNGEVFPLTKK